MSTYKPTVIIDGRENQLDDPDGLEVAHLTSTDYVQFDTSYVDSIAEGRLQWNSEDGTLEVGMPGGDVTLQIGQEQLVRCRNASGNTINNGSVVYVSGQSGNKPLIELSKADDKTTAIVFGVATEDIANNDNGYVNVGGLVRSMNTNGLNEGAYVFLSANTAGALENSPATAPNYKARVGYCLITHNTEGVIFVDSSVVPVLQSLSNCFGTPSDDGDHMAWVSANSRFEVTTGGAVKTGWNTGADTEATITHNSGNLTLSVTPTGNSFDFWVEGDKYTKSSAQSATITDTEGLWFFYFDSTGTLQASQTPWVIADDNKALTAIAYWDADNNEFVTVGQEFHSWVMDADTHARLHYAEGAIYASGLALGNMTVDGNGSSNTHAQVSVGNGVFYDEDIKHTITDGSPQDLSPTLNVPGLYRSGASGLWRKIANSDYPITTTGTGRAAWNEYTANTWQLTEVTNTRYVLSHLFATSDIDNPIVYVVGQNEYATKAAARTGAETELNTLLLGDLAAAFQEFIPIATLIYQTRDSYSNAVQSRIVSTEEGDDYIDWRGSATAASTVSGVTDHGLLSGLTADDHPHYALADGTRTFTGNVTVQGTVNAYNYDTGNYRIDEINSRLQIMNQRDSGDTHFDFMPDKNGGDGEDDAAINLWATGGVSYEYLTIGYDSDASPQRYVIETLAIGAGVHHPIYFKHSGSDIMSINSTGLHMASGADVTVNSGDVEVTSGNVSVNSGNIAVTDGTITVDDYEVALMLGANKTIYVRTTGNDSNDGTTVPTAFLTLGRALTEVRKWQIEDYIVTVDIGEGTYNISGILNPSCTHGSNIGWYGKATEYTNRTINNIDASTSNLATGLEYIDFDVSLPSGSGAAEGQYIIIKTTSGGTNPNLVKGVHEIVTWNGTTNIATVRCARTDSVTTLPSGTITANTLTLVKTVFSFSGSQGIYSIDGLHCGHWDNIVVVGGAGYSGVWMSRHSTIVLGANFATSNWGTNLHCQYHASISADQTVHSYSHGYLVTASSSGSISLRTAAILSGGRTLGCRAYDGGLVNFNSGQVYCGGHPYHVQSTRGGTIVAINANVEGTVAAGSIAFYATSGGGIDATGATDDAATSYNTAATPNGAGAWISY